MTPRFETETANRVGGQGRDRISVAIAGAGLGGLCLAQALVRAGFTVEVYERESAPQTRRQGYRITIDEHGTAALRCCLPPHLFELVQATASPPDEVGYFRFTNCDLNEIFKLTFRPEAVGAPRKLLGQVDRATLRSILLSGLQGRVHYNKAAASATQLPRGALLCFEDGGSVQADVVVGCDGVGSALRGALLPYDALRETGHTGIYGKTPRLIGGRSILPMPLENSGVLAVGAPSRAFFFTAMRFHEPPEIAFARLAPDQVPPITEDYVMWALLFPNRLLPERAHRLEPARLHALALEGAREFHPLLRSLVERAEVDCTLGVAIRAATQPSHWSASRITLLGDAVHVMPPFGGHGGNTALRDAALLSTELQRAARSGEPLEAAIGRFQREMISYAFPAVESARGMLRRLESRNPLLRWAALRAAPSFRRQVGASQSLTAQ